MLFIYLEYPIKLAKKKMGKKIELTVSLEWSQSECSESVSFSFLKASYK